MEFLGLKYNKYDIPFGISAVFLGVLLLVNLAGNINIDVSNRLWGFSLGLCAFFFAYSVIRGAVKKKKWGVWSIIRMLGLIVLSAYLFILGLRYILG